MLVTANGRERWTRELDAGLSIPVVTEKTVLIGERHGKRLYALSREDGSERWRFETRSMVFGDYTRQNVPVGATNIDDLIYVPTAASDLYVLGAPTGTDPNQNTTKTPIRYCCAA